MIARRHIFASLATILVSRRTTAASRLDLVASCSPTGMDSASLRAVSLDAQHPNRDFWCGHVVLLLYRVGKSRYQSR